MKRVLFIALIFALLAAFMCAGAEGFFVPTPVPQATPTPAPSGIVIPTTNPIGSDKLPNPSDYILSVGSKTQEAFVTFGDTVMDAQFFPVYNTGNAISKYLTACAERGYKWEVSNDITNFMSSYKIYGYGYTAYLIPQYENQILLLTQQGMQVDPINPGPDPYEKNKLLMNVNGAIFQTNLIKQVFAYPYTVVGEKFILQDSFFEGNAFKGKSLVFYSENAPYQLVLLHIPDFARTGIEYVMTRDDFGGITFGLVENLKFKLDEETLKYLYRGGKEIESKDAVVIAGENNHRISINSGLKSEDDYLKLQLVYMEGDQYMGRFEGVFNKGETVVSGTFWVEK